jgi:hypothetical protein
MQGMGVADKSLPVLMESFVEILTVSGWAVAPLLSIISVTTPALSLILYSVGLNPIFTTAYTAKIKFYPSK